MAKWTADSRVKIDRARGIIEEFRAERTGWFDQSPPPNTFEAIQSTTAGNVELVVKQLTPVPPKFGAIAGDAVNNLRSALDVLVHQFYVSVAGVPAPWGFQFPIRDTEAEFEKAKSLSQIEGAKPAAAALLRDLRPYKAGNRQLWQLSKLDNFNKHQLLVAVTSGADRIRALQGIMTLHYSTGWLPLVEGATMYSIPAAQANAHLQISQNIALALPGVTENEPTDELLAEMASIVESVVDSFERLP